MQDQDADTFELLGCGRRIRVPLSDGGEISFSVPANTDAAAIIADFERFERAVLFGNSRAIVRFDSRPTTVGGWARYLPLVAQSYVKAWARRAWNNTLGRRTAERRVEMVMVAVRATLAKAEASPSPAKEG